MTEGLTMLDTYRVPAENLTPLRAKLAKITKQAVKLGLPPVTLTEVRRETEPYEELDVLTGEKILKARIWVIIQVHGSQPKLAGWQFVATLAPSDEGTIISAVPGQTVPEQYRNTDAHCDHCHTVRRRREIYVVRHEDGRTAQVGSNCLRDFLGGTDPQAVADYAQMLGAFALSAASGDPLDPRFQGEAAWPLDYFLTWVAYVIRKAGWCSRSAANAAMDRGQSKTATASWVLDLLRPGENTEKRVWINRHGRPVLLEADQQLAETAISWAQGVTAENDYLHNLGVIARTGAVTYRTSGLAASIIAAYQKTLEQAQEKAERAQAPDIPDFTGRHTFAGTIISVKAGQEYYGHRGPRKMLVQAEAGWRVYGSLPAELERQCMAQGGQDYRDPVGATVTLAASIKRSEKDPKFGFFSRPTLKAVTFPTTVDA